MKRYIVIALALVLMGVLSNAQNKTFNFFDLQISYPQNCTIHGFEKKSDPDYGKYCAFIVSARFSDGSEERMKVEVESKLAFSLLSLMSDDDSDALGSIVELFYCGLSSSPVYSHFEEGDSGATEKYAYKDFLGRYYRDKRTSSTMYYENIKGRLYVRLFGDYFVCFTMIIPGENNFKTLQAIANSLTYSY